MARTRRRPPQGLPIGDVPSRVFFLGRLYSLRLGGGLADQAASKFHRDLASVPPFDPPEDLPDAELDDRERESAIARERTRREGRG
jgi:hypothetical protein